MNLAQLNLRRRSDERREQHAKPAIRLGLRCGVSRVLRIIHHTSDRRGCRAPLSRPGHVSTMRADGPGRPRPPPASGSSGDSTCEVWRGPAGSSSADRSVALIAADQGASPCLVRPHTDRYT